MIRSNPPLKGADPPSGIGPPAAAAGGAAWL